MMPAVPFGGRDLVPDDVGGTSGRRAGPAILGALTIVLFALALLKPGPSAGAGSLALSPRWNEVPMPEPLESHRAVAVQVGGSEFIYVLGGKGTGSAVSNRVYSARLKSGGFPDSWTQTRSIYHTAGLQEPAAVAVGSRIYVLGGRQSSWGTFNSVYCAEPDAAGDISDWMSVSPMPTGLTLHAAVAVEDVVFVIGGYSRQRKGFVDTVWAADVSGDDCPSLQWRPQPEESLPRDLAAHSAAAVRLDNGSTFIYVVGGYDGHAYKQVYRAEVDAAGRLTPWVALGAVGPAPSGFFRHASVISGRYLYVIGGTTTGYDRLNAVYRARIRDDGGLDAWSNLDGFPVPVFNHAATVSASGRIYVLGGDADSGILGKGYYAPLLTFEKSASPTGSVTYGDTIAYALTLTNMGVRDLEGLTITDTVQASGPAAFELRDLPGECQIYADAGDVVTSTCTGLSLALGETRRLDFEVTLFQPVSAGYTHYPLMPDCDADLRLDKSCAPNPVGAGQRLSCTLLVHNDGPSPAQDVVVIDHLPDGVTFKSAVPAPSGIRPLTWRLGTIPAGEWWDVHLVVQVDLGSSGTLENTAEVTSGTRDSNPGNNRDVERTVIVRGADLRVEKRDNPDPVSPGGTLTYTLVISNEGPANAHDVSVLDFLPPDLEVVATTPLTFSGSNPLEWRLDLPAGECREVQIVTTVDPGSAGVILNVAFVSSDIDVARSNDVDEEWTAIGSLADLWIGQADDPDPVRPGGTLTYTLWITNEGPSEATNVIVTDTLSAGVCGLDCLSPNCVQSASMSAHNTVVCDLGTVSAGEREGIRMRVTVCPSSSGTLTNEVEVRSEVPDSTPENNQDLELTVIPPPIPVTNKAHVCDGGLWCKESTVINSPFKILLPIILKASAN